MLQPIKSTYSTLYLDKHDSSNRINSVNCRLGLWGKAVDIGLKFYHLGTTGTIINFSVNAVKQSEAFDVDNCVQKFLTIRQGHGANFRYVEQELVIKPFYGTILAESQLSLAQDEQLSVEVGRAISKSFLDIFECIFEAMRRSIHRNFSNPVADLCFAQVNKLFAESTTQNIKTFLSNLHWEFLMNGSQCSQQLMQVIKTTVANNFPRQFAIGHTLKTDIPCDLPTAAGTTVDAGFLANWKASELLRIVCGQKAYDTFMKHGHVLLHFAGYKFKIEPSHWIECHDAWGHKGSLCIHTVNYSVNPVDEITIAWLSIHDNLPTYFKTANIFGSDKFCKDVEKNKAHYDKMVLEKAENRRSVLEGV